MNRSAWCYKFDRDYAKCIRARRGQLGDTWHLDEVYLKIDSRFQYNYDAPLTRMGASSMSLCNPVETRRRPRGSLRSCCESRGMRVVVTDRLISYIAPCAELLPNTVHRRDKGLNNRAESSHRSTRERERQMRGFKSAAHTQRFLSIVGLIADLFGVGHHLLSASNYRLLFSRRFIEWRTIAGVPAAA